MEKRYRKPDIKGFKTGDFYELMGPIQTAYGPGPTLYFQEVGSSDSSVPQQYSEALQQTHPTIYRVV